MGERVLPTMQVLSEVQRHEQRGVEVDRETSRNQNTGAHDHQKGIRGEERRVQLTECAKGQLTESVGVVDIDDDFSWCLDFNRRRWRGDGSWPKFMPFFFLFFFISCALFYSSTRYKDYVQR